jgi:CRP-like cAMP-binding protein
MTQNSAFLDEISDMLIDCPLFNHLQASDIKAVAKHFGINNINKGEIIFREGDEGTFMCIVHEGRVSIVKSNQNDEPVEMGVEGPGRAFGEMAVLDGERRSATCIASTDCVFLTLSKDAMDNMLEEQPRVGAKVLRAIAVNLSKRMRWTAGKLVDLTE